MSAKSKKPQDHEVECLGAYTPKNVASLKKQAKPGKIRKYFIGTSEHPRKLDLSHKRTGILFGYIERAKKGWGKQFFCIRANDVLVPTPLPLDPKRHTDGKGFFPNFLISDESAERLLDDLIEINRERKPELDQIRGALKKLMRSRT
jgi:hypothetical protein